MLTETQSEIWQTLRALNDCWTKGDSSGLVDFFHEHMVAITPSDRLRRTGRAECVAGWMDFAAMARIHSWRELEPTIQVYGDSAVVTYYFEMSFTVGGQEISMGGRDMFVFVKEQGRWWAVADQFSPWPAA